MIVTRWRGLFWLLMLFIIVIGLYAVWRSLPDQQWHAHGDCVIYYYYHMHIRKDGCHVWCAGSLLFAHFLLIFSFSWYWTQRISVYLFGCEKNQVFKKPILTCRFRHVESFAIGCCLGIPVMLSVKMIWPDEERSNTHQTEIPLSLRLRSGWIWRCGTIRTLSSCTFPLTLNSFHQ